MNSVAWSPLGDRLLTSSNDGTVKIWAIEGSDPSSWGSVAELKAHKSKVSAAVWSRDGTQVLSASKDQTARIWKQSSVRQSLWSTVFIIHSDAELRSAAWSADQEYVVVGSEDTTAQIWRGKDSTWSLESRLAGHQGSVEAVAWAPHALTLLTGSVDGTARIWEMNQDIGWITTATLYAHTSAVTGVAWSPDGLQIVTCSMDNTARIFSFDGTWRATAALKKQTGHVSDCDWSVTSRVVICSLDLRAYIWEMDLMGSWRVVEELVHHTGEFIGACQWSPDGSKVATGLGVASQQRNVPTMHLWQIDDVKPSNSLFDTLTLPEQVFTVGWSPDGRQVVVGSLEKAYIWQSGNRGIGGSPTILDGHPTNVISVAWSLDGRYIATCSESTIYLWEQVDGAWNIFQLLDAHQDWVLSVAWSRKGQLLSGSLDHTARIWTRLPGGTLWNQSALLEHQDVIFSVAWSPCGNVIATGGTDTVGRIWRQASLDMSDWVLTETLVGHEDAIFDVEWSPDGQKVLTGSYDKTACVWLKGSDGWKCATALSHIGVVKSVAWSPDSSKILTGSYDQIVRIWMASDQSPSHWEVFQEIRQTRRVLSVAWSPNLHWVLTGASNSANVWEVERPFASDRKGVLTMLSALGAYPPPFSNNAGDLCHAPGVQCVEGESPGGNGSFMGLRLHVADGGFDVDWNRLPCPASVVPTLLSLQIENVTSAVAFPDSLPQSLTHLALRHMNFQHAFLDKLNHQLTWLGGLEELDVSHTNLKGAVVTPPPLALKRANLSNTHIVFVETGWFRLEVLDIRGTPVVIPNNWNVVTRLELCEGDDRCFAATDDAGVFHTVVAGTAKQSGSVYFSKGRICLPGFLPAGGYCEPCREGTFSKSFTTDQRETCKPCQAGRTSLEGASSCNLCDVGFLKDKSSCFRCKEVFQSLAETTFVDTDLCPTAHTTLESVSLPVGYWRVEEEPRILLRCPAPIFRCAGGRRADAWAPGAEYCAEHYEGPKCSLCADGAYATRKGYCFKCYRLTLWDSSSWIFFFALAGSFGGCVFGGRKAYSAFKGRKSRPPNPHKMYLKNKLVVLLTHTQLVATLGLSSSRTAREVGPEFLQWSWFSISVFTNSLHLDCWFGRPFSRMLHLLAAPMLPLLALVVTAVILHRRVQLPYQRKIFFVRIAEKIMNFSIVGTTAALVPTWFSCDLDLSPPRLRAYYEITCYTVGFKVFRLFGVFLVCLYCIAYPGVVFYILRRWYATSQTFASRAWVWSCSEPHKLLTTHSELLMKAMMQASKRQEDLGDSGVIEGYRERMTEIEALHQSFNGRLLLLHYRESEIEPLLVGASDMFSKSHLSSPHAHLFEKLGRIFLSVTTVIEAGTSQSLYGMAVSFGLFMYFGLTCPHVDPEDNSIRRIAYGTLTVAFIFCAMDEVGMVVARSFCIFLLRVLLLAPFVYCGRLVYRTFQPDAELDNPTLWIEKYLLEQELKRCNEIELIQKDALDDDEIGKADA